MAGVRTAALKLARWARETPGDDITGGSAALEPEGVGCAVPVHGIHTLE